MSNLCNCGCGERVKNLGELWIMFHWNKDKGLGEGGRKDILQSGLGESKDTYVNLWETKKRTPIVEVDSLETG